jgi:hypothetical protein
VIVVRQILVCPPGTTLAPVFPRVPVVIGTPVVGSPVFETPVIGAPFFTVGWGNPSAAAPAAPRGADGAAAPSRQPVLVGTVPEDTVRGLATQGARSDRMVVTVAGTAAAVEETTDAHGAHLTTFRLDAEGTSVGVVLWGRPTVRAGEAVRVSGPFFLSTPFVGPSGNPWHNVIEADLLER